MSARDSESGPSSYKGGSGRAGGLGNGGIGGLAADGGPDDVDFRVAYAGISLQHAKLYKVAVRAVTAAGRWREVFSPEFLVDLTPPLAGEVYDGLIDTSGSGNPAATDTEDYDFTRTTGNASFSFTGFSGLACGDF